MIKKSYRNCFACFRLFTHFTTWIINLHKNTVRVEFVSQSPTIFSIFITLTNINSINNAQYMKSKLKSKLPDSFWAITHYTREKSKFYREATTVHKLSPLSKKAEIYFQVELFSNRRIFKININVLRKNIIF